MIPDYCACCLEPKCISVEREKVTQLHAVDGSKKAEPSEASPEAVLLKALEQVRLGNVKGVIVCMTLPNDQIRSSWSQMRASDILLHVELLKAGARTLIFGPPPPQ